MLVVVVNTVEIYARTVIHSHVESRPSTTSNNGCASGMSALGVEICRMQGPQSHVLGFYVSGPSTPQGASSNLTSVRWYDVLGEVASMLTMSGMMPGFPPRAAPARGSQH